MRVTFPRLLLATVLLAPALAPSPGEPARGARLPDGFAETLVADKLTGATALDIAPDGRIFVCEQTGALRVVKDDVLLPAPFVSLTVDSSWERGLLGVAFDPDFAHTGYIYVNYISPRPYPHHRISRWTARGDIAVPGSEVILLEGDDQNKLGGSVQNGHQGGAIHFGPDGKLYIAIGDQTAGQPAQDLHTFQGKILRINRDGSIPGDNPFFHKTTGKYRAIWALGCRNPFTFAFQPGTGRMYINDVGGAFEEINEGVAGANYGWGAIDHGPTTDPRFRGPIHWYKESGITGGAFYNPPVPQFPAEYVGKYFFTDFKAGWIKVLDPDHPQKLRDFASGFVSDKGVVDLKVAADGSLYYLDRGAWVKDKDFRPNTGRLVKVRYTGSRTPPYLIAQPSRQTIARGRPARFRVRAAGTPPLRYQWQRDGKPVAGATAPTYTIPAVADGDGGAVFRCVVSNAFGRVMTEPAALAVKVSGAARDAWISPRPGTYTGPVTVRLRPEDGGTFHYTTDGSEPTASSPAFHEPFVLRRSARLRARLFLGECPSGRIRNADLTVRGDRPYGLLGRESMVAVKMPLVPENLPPLLSQTGVFRSLADLTPAPGLVPYDVNTPLWSDGARKRRWLGLPPGDAITFASTGEWAFPPGTVLVKHFDLPLDETNPALTRRLETRLLVVDETGYGYGVTYRWQPDGRDAELLPDGRTETFTIKTAAGTRQQTWTYPGRADCLACHTPAAGFVLGVKTRQLNRERTYAETGITDNQLRTWNYLGLFDPPLDEGRIGGFARMVAVTDGRAPLELRVRSYLDANCANCHRPGHTVLATFDARFDTPLEDQGIVNAPTVSDSLGMPVPRLVTPRNPARSMLFHRLARADNFRMPPLGRTVPDRDAIRAFEEWVRQLPASAGPR
jgi:uncharacterized repeat protein (TIGR03806 family)